MFFNGLKIPEFPVSVLKLDNIFSLNDFLAPLETVLSFKPTVFYCGAQVNETLLAF